MRRNLSITTAAAALLIGTVFAAAQGVQRQAPGGAGGAEPSIQGQGGTQVAPQEGQGKGKAQSKEPRTQGQGGGQAQGQGQTAPEGKGKAQSKEPRTQGQGGQGQRETQGQRDSQPQQGQQPKQQPQQGQQAPRDNQKGAEGKAGGAQTGGVTLNAQQRTTIRTTVLQGSNAPRVNNVKFSINVGTAVPRTGVRLVAVPSTLVEIHPAWRGYLYFIVGERIIIVEPESHRIVAVLVV